MRSLIEKPAAGLFKAVCRKTEARLLNALDAEAYTSLPEDVYTWWDSKLGGEAVHIQCDLETTDRATYDAHMKLVHGARLSNGENGPWASTIKAGAYRPRLLAEGKPWKDPSRTKTPLVAEVDYHEASVLWWAEHERGCALAQVAS